MGEHMTLEQAHTEGFELVRRHSAAFADAIGGLGDDDLARPVPGMDWTVGQVVAHVQSVYERYTIDRRRAPDVAGVATYNQQDVARIGVDVAAAAASIKEQLDTLAPAVPLVAPEQLFPFHADGTTTMAGGWGNLLGELLAHGDDIGRATGWDFAIPGDDLELVWRFSCPLLAWWTAPAAAAAGDASWDLVFGWGAVQFRFEGGAMTHSTDDDRPDPLPEHHEMAVVDAAEYTLGFPYRRRPPQDEATALLLARFVAL